MKRNKRGGRSMKNYYRSSGGRILNRDLRGGPKLKRYIRSYGLIMNSK
jgi:hypothetical protein